MVREQYAGKAVAAERVVVAAHEKGVCVVIFVVGEQAKADGAVKVLGFPRRIGRCGSRWHALVDHACLSRAVVNWHFGHTVFVIFFDVSNQCLLLQKILANRYNGAIEIAIITSKNSADEVLA